MKRILFALALVGLSGIALGSSTVATKPGDYVLRNKDNSDIAELIAAKKPTRFATLQECAEASKALKSGAYKCDQSTALTVTSTCADEPAPRLYLSLVDLEGGGKGYALPEMEPPQLAPGSDTEFLPERDWLFVHGPTWPAGFPNCWVRGWDDPLKWRQNFVKDPGKVFLELITPENVAEVYELPNTIEPVTPPPGFDEEWHSPEAEAARHLKCQCYADDKTPCPPIPGPNCPAMQPQPPPA